MSNRLEIKLGDKYGRLVIIRELRAHSNSRYFLCGCKCGNQKVIALSSLRRGATKSCGCLYTESRPSSARTHGLSDTTLYKTWRNVKYRCSNSSLPDYKYYGGRGIFLCREWLDFQSFYNWALSHGYKENLTIERIHNGLGYSPENCRWATRKEQARNKRTNHRISYNGITKILAEWAKVLKIKPGTLRARIAKGWAIEKAFTKPIQATGRSINDSI